LTFILPAFAEAPAAPGGAAPLFHTFVMMFLIIIIFYFLLIRPQKKRQEEHHRMIEALKKGDEIITSAGIHAQIADIREDHFVLKIADNVRIKATKASISQKISGEAGGEAKSK